MRKLTPDFQASQNLLDLLVDCFGKSEDLPEIIAVAVSGGSDSMALLRLAHHYWRTCGKDVVALTVDHGLRAESADEAKQVAAWCSALGVEHHVLNWAFEGKGNLSAAARKGRYRLMAGFCKSHGIEHLFTGHTMDDQAETVLMRFARGSGVDGLAAMARETKLWGVTIVRPFLTHATRAELRTILDEFGQAWVDDPTNDDPSYDRVKARELFTHLEPLGVTVQSLSGLAHRMGLAKEVLEREASGLVEAGLHYSSLGYAALDVDALAAVPLETACRVIGRTATQIGGRGFRAQLRFEEQLVAMAMERAETGGKTSGGCVFRPAGDRFNILREPGRCVEKTPLEQFGGEWDNRFCYQFEESPDLASFSIGAVGEAGLTQIPRDYEGFSEAWLSAPREARLTTPGLWHGDVLVSAPLAPWSNGPSAPKLHVSTLWSKKC